MKPLIRFFAKLYPPQWRQRYGAEFDALLDDVEPSAKTALNVISGATFMQIRVWNVGTILAAAAMAGLLVGLGITTTIPKAYASQGVIGLPPGPVTQDTRDAINTMANEIESRASLTRIVSTLGLYPQERAKMPIEDVIDVMKRNIWILPVTPVGRQPQTVPAFAVQFAYSDPELAQKVAAELMSRFFDVQGTGTMKILDAASLPHTPFYPHPRMMAFLGLVAGMALGAVVVFFHRRRLKAA
jgi:hypothetical protein